ncbi:hypothetical protein ACQ4PT_027546 [Festuca glaucescens]
MARSTPLVLATLIAVLASSGIAHGGPGATGHRTRGHGHGGGHGGPAAAGHRTRGHGHGHDGGHGGPGAAGHRTRGHGGVLQKTVAELRPDVIVSKRGGGANVVSTIGQALIRSTGPREARPYFVIYVSQGTYEEHVVVTAGNVVLIGDGMGRTIITGNRSKRTGHNTEQSATVTVIAHGFLARDLDIRNTAGAPEDEEAVALLLAGNEAVMYNCVIQGFQDTLYAKEHSHFYRGCHIFGTIDFVFEDAAAVFQDCYLYARPPSAKGKPDIVTAQGRMEDKTSGFIFQNCSVMASTLPGEKGEAHGR